MDNNFNIKSYFAANFGLGNKPTVSKSNFKLNIKHVIALIIAVVLLFVKAIIGILAVALVGGIFIALPIIKEKNKINQEKKALEDWQNNYNYRYNNWDAEYDKFCQKVIADLNARERGMKKIGLDEASLKESDREDAAYVAEPFSITGKRYTGYYRWGKDGVSRTDDHEITWLYFSKEQLYIYTVQFKLTDLTRKTENTLEFFYSDIVSVSTGSKTVDTNNAVDGGKISTVESEEFKLVVPGDKLSFAFTTTEFVSRSVQGMKNLIRIKKNG